MFENTETHESYGTLSFSRCSSSHAKPLFGSSIKHRDTIRMRLHEADINRHLNRDWIHGNKLIAEVEMSYSQFAEVITSMNIGEGIPVTLKYVQSKGEIEDCPFIDKRVQFETEFADHLKENNENINSLISEVAKLFEEKKTFNKADKENIITKLSKIKMDIGCNAEYIYSSFNEQMDKTTMEAKGEVEAFVQNKINTIAQASLIENRDEFKSLKSPIDME
jgi:CRISPR/Cas system CMR-associated protein Cmr5 small subunit